MKTAFYFRIAALFIITGLFIFSGCTVNSSTGKITIKNASKQAVTNIKLGDTYLALRVLPGQSVEYYYFQAMKGKLSMEGVDSYDFYGYDPNGDGNATAMDKLDFNFSVNQWVDIEVLVKKNSSGLSINGTKVSQGDSYLQVTVLEQAAKSSLSVSDYCSE